MQSIPSQEKLASLLMDVNVAQVGARLEGLESPLLVVVLLVQALPIAK